MASKSNFVSFDITMKCVSPVIRIFGANNFVRMNICIEKAYVSIVHLTKQD